MAKGDRVRTKRRFGIGSFIFGWFIGFICTILIIAGAGYWIYTSVSVGKVEKWTKTEIAGDNEGVKKLTLQDAVGIAMGVAKGSNEYTLNKFEEDFGVKLIGDSFYGIDMSILKNAPIKKLNSAINDTFDSATFNNILSFMEVNEDELGLLNTVLDGTVTYYVDSNTLYLEEGHSTEVEFDYTIEGTTVKFSNGSHTISGNKINPRLRDLPLKTAMNSMATVTNDLKIYEILGYYKNEDKYYEKFDGTNYSDEVTGMLKTLAGYSVEDLSKNETFNGLHIYEVMGYYYDEEGTKEYYKSEGDLSEDNRVKGVLRHLAPSTIGDLSTTINDLTLGQALDVDKADASGVVRTFYDKPISQLADSIKDIKIYQALGYYEHNEKYYQTFDGTNYSDEVTGMMATLAPYSVNDLSNSTTFNNLYIHEVMGYYYDATTEAYYKKFDGTTYSEKVTGAMSMMADSTIGGIETRVNTIINGTKLNELFDAGVIDGSTLSAKTKMAIGEKTIPELMAYVDSMIQTLP